MNSFISRRRDFLRAGRLWTAAASVPGTALAVSIQAGPPPRTGFQVRFDVRSFGAAGDGKALDTVAVNRAIEAASAVGGGMVVFPAGTYLCFSIHLKSKVHLYLEQGCAIVAADSPRKGETTGYNGGVYDPADLKTEWDSYQDYGRNHWHNSLIWGEGIHDFSITGPGLIWGRGLSHGYVRPGETVAPFIAEQSGVGNKAIALKICRNVLLRDFSMLKGGHFCLLLTGVDLITPVAIRSPCPKRRCSVVRSNGCDRRAGNSPKISLTVRLFACSVNPTFHPPLRVQKPLGD